MSSEWSYAYVPFLAQFQWPSFESWGVGTQYSKKTELPPPLRLNSVRQSSDTSISPEDERKEETHTYQTKEPAEEREREEEGGGGSHRLQATQNCIRG